MRLLTIPGSSFYQVTHVNDRVLVSYDWRLNEVPHRGYYRVWDLAGGAPRTLTWQHERVIRRLFVPGGPSYLRSRGLWPEGELVPPALEGPGSALRLDLGFEVPLAYAPDSSSAIHAGNFHDGDHRRTLFRLHDGQGEHPLHEGNSGLCSQAVYSADGKWAVMSSGDPLVSVWDMTERREVICLEQADRVVALAFSPGGLLAVAGGRTVRVWDVSEGLVHKFRSFRKYVSALAWSPDGRLLAASSPDGTVRLWEMPAGRELAKYDFDIGEVKDVAFSPDGSTATAAGQAGLLMWDLG